MDALLATAFAVVAVVLFASGRLRLDLVALLILVGLALSGLVTPAEAVSGFANPATVTVLAMLILAAGLTRTGAMQVVGRVIGQVAQGSPWRLALALMLTGAVLSSVVNNTAVVAVLLPVAIKLGDDSGVSPSKLLIPLSFASMFGGTNTLIGTSTNLLVSALAEQHGLPGFTLFEFAQLGVVLTAAGIAYMMVAGLLLLPGRRGRELAETYHLREYLAEATVGEDSKLVGKTIADVGFEDAHGVEVVGMFRARRRLFPVDHVRLQAGDLLLVQGPAKALLDLRQEPGLGPEPELRLDATDLGEEDVVLAEAVVPPMSRLRGRSLGEMFFRHRYNLTVLAIQRWGVGVRQRLSRTSLAMGDTLLLQGPRRFLEELAREGDLLVVGEVDAPPRRRSRVWVALLTMVGVVGLAGVGLFPVMVTALAGVVVMVLTGCLTMQEAYESVDWSVIFLLAGIIPLGIALERSGAALILATWAVDLAGGLGPGAVLSLFYLLASLLTEVMSNNATAVLLTPIAGVTAAQLGVDARPFLAAIAFAASASFMTPLGYQTNVLVYSPGGYRYMDYVKVGGPLNVLFWILSSFLIPVFWPFR